jgi:hypothetical protein
MDMDGSTSCSKIFGIIQVYLSAVSEPLSAVV